MRALVVYCTRRNSFLPSNLWSCAGGRSPSVPEASPGVRDSSLEEAASVPSMKRPEAAGAVAAGRRVEAADLRGKE